MSIFNHITVGCVDLGASETFYDAVLAPLGLSKLGSAPERAAFYGDTVPQLVVTKPFNGDTATFGNGVTVSLRAPTRAAVDAFHAAGCAAGGQSEGAPGHREKGPAGNYVAYLRDPVGNKIAAITYSAE